VVGEGDELLAEPEHLDRVRLHPGERLDPAVDQQALGPQAEPNGGRITEHLAGPSPKWRPRSSRLLRKSCEEG